VEEAGAGLTCPAEDPEALAQGVRRLHGMDREERQALGARGRAYFLAHFEREHLVTRVEAEMAEAIEERRCAS
jgi:colanic acid biosynthesis glycosyl transferase WcaI